MSKPVIKGWFSSSRYFQNPNRTPVNFSQHTSQFKPVSTSTSYSIVNEPPVYDQGVYGSCVANAVCGALSIVQSVEGNTPTLLSRMFLYYLSRLRYGTPQEDCGSDSGTMIDQVMEFGVCRESTWDYTAQNFPLNPSMESYTEAFSNRPTAWLRIDASGSQLLDQIESAVRSNHPVIFGTPVDDAIMTYQKGQILSTPSGNIIGGHEMVVVGVDYSSGSRAWKIRNSWGSEYGDEGHLLINDSWMSWNQVEGLNILTNIPAFIF